MVPKAKRSAAAYEPAPPRKPEKRGAPRKKGDSVKVMSLLQGRHENLRTTKAMMYGTEQETCYYCLDLLRGQGHYQKLPFVLVEYNGTKSVLVCTDLEMDPVGSIEAYCRRFRIETSFREFTQQVDGMAYHFGTETIPRLNHYSRKTDPAPLWQSRKKRNGKKSATLSVQPKYTP